MPKFPGPYVNDCKEDDPMIKRVDMDYTGIASRKSGMPTTMTNGMNIDHVGGSTSGTLTRRQS